MPELKKINVVFLYVAGLERARRFYEDIVGFGEPFVVTQDWVEYRLAEGANFALHRTTQQALEGGDPARNTLKFSIVVKDLGQAYRELAGKGVVFIRRPEHGPGFELAEFEDPEGNQIRLLEYTQPEQPT